MSAGHISILYPMQICAAISTENKGDLGGLPKRDISKRQPPANDTHPSQ